MFKPDIDKKSMQIIEKLKEQGKFKNAVDHMTQDVQHRQIKQKKAFIIEVKTEKQKKQKVNLNEKSNKMIAAKFK